MRPAFCRARGRAQLRPQLGGMRRSAECARVQERWAALKARGAGAEDGCGTLLRRVVAAAAARFPAAEAAALAGDLLRARPAPATG